MQAHYIGRQPTHKRAAIPVTSNDGRVPSTARPSSALSEDSVGSYDGRIASIESLHAVLADTRGSSALRGLYAGWSNNCALTSVGLRATKASIGGSARPMIAMTCRG